MWLYRCCQAGWTVGTLLIALSWFRVVEANIGWIGFAIALAASFVSRKHSRKQAEFSHLQQQIDWLDRAIAAGEGSLGENLLDRAIAKCEAGRFEDALIDLDAALKHGVEHRSVALHYRGFANGELDRHQEAVDDLTDAIQLASDESQLEALYALRASIYLVQGHYHLALDDCDEALRLSPESTELLTLRGTARQLVGDYADAIRDFEHALQIDPQFMLAHNNLATILACCPVAHLRSGARAVEHATRAYKASSRRTWVIYSVLAGAYAEADDFERAVRYARKSLRLAPAIEQAERQSRLEQFLRHEPYRTSVEADQLAYQRRLCEER